MIESEVYAAAPAFMSHTATLNYVTSQAPQFIDVTDDVADIVDQSRVKSGIVVIFSRHTTAAIKINESEPELLKDMAQFLGEIAPLEHDYHHNNFDVRTVNMEEDECPNAHSHCQHLMLSASENVPILGGKMQLGRWQRVFLVELDRARPRQVQVQVLGV